MSLSSKHPKIPNAEAFAYYRYTFLFSVTYGRQRIYCSCRLSQGMFIEMATRSYPYGRLCFIEALCGTFVCCKLAEALSELTLLIRRAEDRGGAVGVLCDPWSEGFVSTLDTKT